jgi:general stress protein YciG
MQESTNPIQQEEKKTTSLRGFASMNPEKQRLIAQTGGRVAHQRGVAHRWTSEEARLAGRKGGQNSRNNSGERKNNEPTIG